MKAKRQAKIMELITTGCIETQEQLLAALLESGFQSTQATISRDIKEMRIVKELTPKGSYRYTMPPEVEDPDESAARLNTIFRKCVTNYDFAQNIVVIKTMPGLADAACSAVDTMAFPGVVGSLAGDDTAMIVMRDNGAAADFCGELKALLG